MNARPQIGPDDFELPPPSVYEGDAPRPKGNGKAVPAVGTFVVNRLDDIDSKPRVAIVQGLGLDREAVAAIVGSPNAGKTAFAVSLAVHLAARAERWLGLKITGGPVVYFGAEAPGSVIMRARAAAQRIQAQGLPLYISPSVPGLGGELSATVDAERIIATIRTVEAEEGAAVVALLLDTLAACLADGDENGDGMIRLVNAAKHIAALTGTLVILIHHPSKGDAAGLRGHGSLAAACDSIIRIETDELTGVRTATLMKARDCATGLQVRFELESVVLEERDSFGDPRTTIVVKSTTQAVARKRPSGQRQQQLLMELERRYRTGERAWDEAALRKAGRDLGMQDQSARDAVRGLQKAGYLVGGSADLRLKYPPEGTEGTK